ARSHPGSELPGYSHFSLREIVKANALLQSV
ncbi:MAG: hypothetical protein ACI9VS_003831, partial [Candidatus Binatia bacterium]